MKKTISAFSFVLLSFSISMAQIMSPFQKSFFGVKVGGNFSSYYGSDAKDANAKGRFSYCFGLYNTNRINETVAIEAELLYTDKGAKLSSYDPYYNISHNEEQQLSYLQFPLLLRLYTTEELISPFLEVGPTVAVNTSAKYKGDINGESYSGTLSHVNKTEITFIVGGGFETTKFNCGLRYDFGTSDIRDHVSAKNSTYQLQAGYKL